MTANYQKRKKNAAEADKKNILEEISKKPMDLALLTLNDDSNIKANLKVKYLDLKSKVLRAFLLPGWVLLKEVSGGQDHGYHY